MIPKAIDQAVRERAAHVCEYCRLPQWVRRLRFPIDHIVARQHRGPTTPENLALCCPRCNRHKGPNLSGVDPVTGTKVGLFNPRNSRGPIISAGSASSSSALPRSGARPWRCST